MFYSRHALPKLNSLTRSLSFNVSMPVLAFNGSNRANINSSSFRHFTRWIGNEIESRQNHRVWKKKKRRKITRNESIVNLPWKRVYLYAYMYRTIAATRKVYIIHFAWKESLSTLLFRVTITRATTVVLIIRTVMDHFRAEGMRPNNT